MASKTPLSVLDPKGSATIEDTYAKMAKNLKKVKEHTPKLTLAEKIIYGHLDDPKQVPVRGKTYLNLRPVSNIAETLVFILIISCKDSFCASFVGPSCYARRYCSNGSPSIH